jgi:hypothetical protein
MACEKKLEGRSRKSSRSDWRKLIESSESLLRSERFDGV